MAISDKLKSLNETKGLIKKGLNDLGANLTDASSFRSYANILSEMYEDHPKAEGEGTILSLSPTKQGKLIITPKGASSQFSSTGSNILNNINYSLGGISFDDGSDINESNTYRFNEYISINENTVFYLLKNLVTFYYDENKSLISSNTSQDLQKTTPAGTKYVRFRTFVGDFSTFDSANYMVSLNTITSYEPYTGGKPAPNPDYSQDIKSVTEENSLIIMNENLFNKDTVTKNFYLNSNGELIGNQVWSVSDYIPVIQNEKYTYSGLTNVGQAPMACYYDENKQFISAFKHATGTNQITIPSKIKFIRFTIERQTSTNLKTFIFVKGSTLPNTYVEHEEQKYSIALKSWNLLPNTAESTTSNGITFTVNKDKSVTINGTATNNAYIKINEGLTLKPGRYMLTGNPGGSASTYRLYAPDFPAYDDGSGKAFTLTEEKASAVNLLVLSGTTVDNVIIKPQIVEETEIKEYHPYTENPIELNSSPDGTIRDEIVGSSDISYNLFDKNNANILNAYINGTNKIIVSNANARTLYIPCESNTEYTVQRIVGQRFIAISSPNYEIGTTGTNIVQNNTGSVITITTGANDKYLCIFYYLSTVDTLTEQEILDSIQITEGSEVKPYFPYGQVGMWCKREYIGKVVFDGSENWEIQWSIAGGNNVNGFRTYISDILQATLLNEIPKIYCNYYTPASQNTCGSNSGRICSRINQSQIIITNNDISTTSALKTWLSTHNTIVYYVLATPQDIPITDTTLIEQLNNLYDNGRSYDGTTNITSTYENGNEQMYLDGKALMNLNSLVAKVEALESQG